VKVAAIIRKILLWLAGIVVALYVGVCGYLFAQQRQAIYHSHLTGPGAPPAGYAVLDVNVPGIGVMKDWWAPPAAGMPTTVFFHGNGGDVKSLQGLSVSLHQHGWGVLLASFPGFSGNPGKPSEEAFMADARATIAAVPARGSAVIVWGHSLGSGVAARMASEGRAAGLVLEAPYTSLPDMAERVYPYIPVHLLMLDRFDTRALAGRIGVPVLIFHSTDDPEVPFAMGQTLARELGARATLVTMQGVGHYPHRSDLSGTVIQWARDHCIAPVCRRAG